jgi:hypothetical protein
MKLICYGPTSQEIVQSIGITLNEVVVNSSNPSLPLIRTCQKKKNYGPTATVIQSN